MVAFTSVELHNLREWKRFENNLSDIYRKNTPKAMQRTINELARRAKVQIVKKVASEPLKMSDEGAFRYATVPPLPPAKVAQKVIRPLIHVRGGRMSKAAQGNVQASIHGYAWDLSAIRLGKSKGGVLKGTVDTSATHTITKSGQKRRLANPRVGGIATGGVKMPQAFLNQARRNQQPLLFRRAHRNTWKPGESGWSYERRGMKAPYSARMPFGVVKYNVRDPMVRNMEPLVQKTISTQAKKVFDQQMGFVIGKQLATGK